MNRKVILLGRMGKLFGKEHKVITDYMERVFSRETFQNSLSEDEEEMHL